LYAIIESASKITESDILGFFKHSFKYVSKNIR